MSVVSCIDNHLEGVTTVSIFIVNMRLRSCVLSLLIVALLFCGSEAASSKKRTSKKANSVKSQGLDKEITRKRNQCGADAAVLQTCLDEDVDVDNCIMRCVALFAYVGTFYTPVNSSIYIHLFFCAAV